MDTIRGVIRPNNGHIQHLHGDGAGGAIHFTAPRPFIVDPKAARVVDEPGKPLVLTSEIYESLREKFGGPLVVEPVGGVEGAVSAEEMRAAVAEIERRGQLLEEADAKAAELEQQLQAAHADLAQRDARIAELEQQLQAKPPKPRP
jgi:hypothetical protein